MKTYWKWILGILIVLAVLIAIPLGMHFLINRGYIKPPMVFAFHQRPAGPNFDKQNGFNDWNGPRGFGDNGGWSNRGEGHRGRGFGFFGPLMFIGGLLKLAVFGGLLYGAYWLGKRNARITLDAAPAALSPSPKRGTRAAKKG
jgi:hypothetical protein